VAGGSLEITEEKIRQIVRETQRLLGPEAHPDMVRKVTREVVHRLQEEGGGSGEVSGSGQVVCVVLLGPDQPEAQRLVEEVVTAAEAGVVAKSGVSYGGQCARLFLVRVVGHFDHFESKLRSVLPDGWHAMIHPLSGGTTIKGECNR
jgi:hypothetical protein